MLARQTKNISIFEVVSEPSRRKIINFLRSHPRTVGQIVQHTQLSQPGVSKHLRILREAGLVTVIKESQKHYYHLQGQPLVEIDNWLEPYRKYWTERLDALEQLLDEEE